MGAEKIYSRRDVLKMGAASLLSLLGGELFLAACAPATAVVPSTGNGQPIAGVTAESKAGTAPTPLFKDTKPTFPQTPTRFDSAGWIAIVNNVFNPEASTIQNLKALDRLPNQLQKNRILEVLLANEAAAKGGTFKYFDELRKSGQIIGSTLCGDSRVICQTMFSAVDKGVIKSPQFAAIEARSLGGAPRVFERGVNVSILATHCNSSKDITGCGALQALAELQKSGGDQILRQHGLAKDTIDEILSSLSKASKATPDEQANMMAIIQARINAINHGGDRHITVAVKIGHADKSMEVIDAFDNLGKRVAIEDLPDFAKRYIAVNSATAGEVDAYLKSGQKPFEYWLNATGYNIQDMAGPKTGIPGQAFKITARPQTGDLARAINLAEIKQAVAGINYPLAHDWGRIQWVLAKNYDELAAIRSELLASDKAWEFLGRGGVVVEAVIDKGKIDGAMHILQAAELVEEKADIARLKRIGLTTDVILSKAALRNAEKMIAEAKAAGAKAEEASFTKAEKIVKWLESKGTLALKILGKLQPLFYAQMTIEATDKITKLLHMGIIQTVRGNIAVRTNRFSILTTSEYNSLKNSTPKVNPSLSVAGLFQANINQKNLGERYWRMMQMYNQELGPVIPGGPSGSYINGPVNPNSPFYGINLDNLAGVIEWEFLEPHNNHKPITLRKFGSPLVYKPLPNIGTDNIPKWNYSEEGLAKHEFFIVDPDTGKEVFTNVESEMILPYAELNPEKGTENTLYYLKVRSDGKGIITTTSVAYKEDEYIKRTKMEEKKPGRRGELVKNMPAKWIPDPLSPYFNNDGEMLGITTGNNPITNGMNIINFSGGQVAGFPASQTIFEG